MGSAGLGLGSGSGEEWRVADRRREDEAEDANKGKYRVVSNTEMDGARGGVDADG